MGHIQRGTKRFRLATLALFAGGFNTFAILWGPQPLLPEIAREFNISPTVSSLSLSVSTIALAIAMLAAGSVSEVIGRKRVMAFALISSSILAVLTAFSPNFGWLIAFRILQGITLAGLPAVAMAYLGEEVDKRSLGLAMGLYISGNSIGGMGGRIISGIVTDYFGWHAALAAIGLISLAASVVFFLALPASAQFKPQKFEIKKLTGSLFSQFKTRGLVYLFAIAFLLMGGFVSAYNYIGFELTGPPYSLSQTLVGFIFIVYIVGTFASTWMGMLADRFGRKKTIQTSLLILLGGILLTLAPNLWLKIAGLAIFTYGFFGSHSIASGWVGRMADHSKAQAAALYLFFYYVGSSIGGTAGGAFYTNFGWLGVVMMVVILGVLALGASVRVGKLAKKRRAAAKRQTATES